MLFQSREFAGLWTWTWPQSLILHTSILSHSKHCFNLWEKLRFCRLELGRDCRKAPRPELAGRTANPEFTIRRLDVFKVTRLRWPSSAKSHSNTGHSYHFQVKNIGSYCRFIISSMRKLELHEEKNQCCSEEKLCLFFELVLYLRFWISCVQLLFYHF